MSMYANESIDGETFEQFAEHLFSCEYCAECHGDDRHHEPWIVMGHWFAHCKFSRVIRRNGRSICIRRKR